MLLAPSPGANFVLPVGDSVQIFSTTANGAQWNRQLLLKAPRDYSVRVASLAEERRRVEAVLEGEGVRFVTVRIDDPSRPALVILERASAEERAAALRAARHAMPYARDVVQIDTALESIDEQARAVLLAAGCAFRRVDRKDGATYRVTGALSDESLALLQRLVHEFSQKWGTRSIDFRIQLRTDWLKGKAYRDGSDGYVLLDPASWYFPQSL
jgi:type III secretion system PrgH/EprH family protein